MKKRKINLNKLVQAVKIPVHEMCSRPGPKYSTIAPVPPFTVRMSATLRMISLGEVQPPIRPVSFTPITCNANTSLKRCVLELVKKESARLIEYIVQSNWTPKSKKFHETRIKDIGHQTIGKEIASLRALELPRDVGHYVHRVRAAHTDE